MEHVHRWAIQPRVLSEKSNRLHNLCPTLRLQNVYSGMFLVVLKTKLDLNFSRAEFKLRNKNLSVLDRTNVTVKTQTEIFAVSIARSAPVERSFEDRWCNTWDITQILTWIMTLQLHMWNIWHREGRHRENFFYHTTYAFRVNLHSVFAWMPRNILFEGAISKIRVTATGFELTTT